MGYRNSLPFAAIARLSGTRQTRRDATIAQDWWHRNSAGRAMIKDEWRLAARKNVYGPFEAADQRGNSLDCAVDDKLVFIGRNKNELLYQP